MSFSTLIMGWRNLGRNKRRTFLAIGAIALGQFTLVLVNSLMAGFFQDILETITGPMVGHVQLQHAAWREERAVDLYLDDLEETRELLAQLPRVERVSPRIFSFALAASGEESDTPAEAETCVIAGLDVPSERTRGGMLEGLHADDLPGPGEVVLGRVLAGRLGVVPGQLLALIGQDADGFPASDLFTVKSVVDSNVELIKTVGVIMSLEEAGRFLVMPNQAHEIVVYGNDFREADALKSSISDISALSEASVMTWREAIPQVVLMINLKTWFDLIFISIVFIAAAAGIANTALMSTFERKHEFGMLLAIGARPRRIVNMVIIEAVILGLIGVAIGSLLGTIAVLITSHTGFNYAALGGGQADAISYKDISISLVIYPQFELRHVIFGLLAVTFTSVAASLWPALHASRLEPMEAMRT